MDHTPEPTYTVAQVAEHLACDRSGVYRLVRTGQLRGVRIGRLVRIPASALDDFLAGSSETSPTSGAASGRRNRRDSEGWEYRSDSLPPRAFGIVCPTCSAPEGAYCRSANGVKQHDVHGPRWQAYRQSWTEEHEEAIRNGGQL